jgi:hypothetical protein
MGSTFLRTAFGELSPETLAAMNQVVATYAIGTGQISGEKERLDSTVYETNIHYPTDSSLLRDSFRTLSRHLRQIQREFPGLHLDHRFHDKTVKKLARALKPRPLSTRQGARPTREPLVYWRTSILTSGGPNERRRPEQTGAGGRATGTEIRVQPRTV